MAVAKTKKEKFREQVKQQQAKRKEREEKERKKERAKRRQIFNERTIEDIAKERKGNRSKKINESYYLEGGDEPLFNIGLSSDMTIQNLRRFIRKAVGRINADMESINELDEDDQIRQSIDYIKERFGANKNGDLSMLSRANKEELLAYARNLKAHFTIDDYTSAGREEIDNRVQKAWSTYLYNNPGSGVSKQDFGRLAKVFQGLNDKLITIYGSKEVIKMYTAVSQKNIGSADFVSMALDIYKKNKNSDDKTLIKLMRENIRKTYGVSMSDEDM